FTLSVVPLGAWADRAKRKNVIAVCVAVWSLATAFTALTGNFVQLLISRMVLGIGEAGYGPASGAIMADYFSREKRARTLSWWGTAALVGLMIGIIVGGVVAGLGFGLWRWAFLFTGIPGLILAFLVWRIREPQRNQADAEAAALDPDSYRVTETTSPLVVPKKILAQLGILLRIKSLLVLTIMQIFAFFVLAASAVYLPTLFQQKDTFGLSSGAAGLFSGTGIAVAGITGIILGGYLSDVLKRRHSGARVLVCGIGFLIGAPFYILSVVVALTWHNIFFYSFFFFSTTLLLNMYVGPSIAAMQDIAPSAVRASAVAISAFISHLMGDAFSPSLVGALARIIDPTQGQHFVQNIAGYDLSMALVYTCPAALAIAGLVGIFGSRWIKSDMEAAQLAEQSNE
ncbi:MAG: MFS transporter, partial [Ktedonobacteraceae bacterium]|nr:MFS transporter [Ktedonobacteraceae bacterium]